LRVDASKLVQDAFDGQTRAIINYAYFVL